MSKKMTSAEWAKLLAPGTEVYDPDGWDRQNFQYSWNEELITKKEFERRFNESTVTRKATGSIWRDEDGN